MRVNFRKKSINKRKLHKKTRNPLVIIYRPFCARPRPANDDFCNDVDENIFTSASTKERARASFGRSSGRAFTKQQLLLQ